MEHYRGRPEPLNLEPPARPLSEAPISKRGLSPVATRIGLVAATLAVGGAGFFAVDSALQAPAGPESPVAAVEQLFEAVENEDLLGVAEVLLPSERESLVDPSFSLLGEVERLGLIDEVDLSNVDGIDIEIEGLETLTRQVNDQLVLVEVVAGTATVVESGQIGAPDPDSGAETIALAELQVPLAVVKDDGSWYVSAYYTAAEELRAQAGLDVPAFGDGPEPVGADTPEGALASLINEALALDPKGIITSLDPQEARVLYDYSPLFLPDAEKRAASAHSDLDESQVSWRLERLDVSANVVRGRTVATVDAASLLVDFGEETVRVAFDGDCVSYGGEAEPQETFCTHEVLDELNLGEVDLVAKLVNVESGITVIERDGRWYVSTMPTLLYFYRDVLASLEPADLDLDLLGTSLTDSLSAAPLSQLLLGMTGPNFDDLTVFDNAAPVDGVARLEAVSPRAPRGGFISVDGEIDSRIAPAGFLLFGYFSDDWMLSFEVEPPEGVVVTQVSPESGSEVEGAVEVATFATVDDVDAVVLQLTGSGWEELAADDLPSGARRFGYADFQTAVLFEGRLISEWMPPFQESETHLAVLEHLAGQ